MRQSLSSLNAAPSSPLEGDALTSSRVMLLTYIQSQCLERAGLYMLFSLFEYMHLGSGCVSAMNEVDGYIGHPEPPVCMISALPMFGCTSKTSRLWMSTLFVDPTYIFSWLLYLQTIWLSNSILLSITKH